MLEAGRARLAHRGHSESSQQNPTRTECAHVVLGILGPIELHQRNLMAMEQLVEIHLAFFPAVSGSADVSQPLMPTEVISAMRLI
jgi:hypothetical protein